MKKLLISICIIICSLQVTAQKEYFFKTTRGVYSIPINGLVSYPDTLTCPVNTTVFYIITCSGEGVGTMKYVILSNLNGVYKVGYSTPKAFPTGYALDFITINKQIVVRLTLAKKPTSDFVYQKL